jgi:hypothetical protein
MIVRDWSCEAFHRRVLELEDQGYTVRPGTYTITPEMNPETGEVIHLYVIEMIEPEGKLPRSPGAGYEPRK